MHRDIKPANVMYDPQSDAVKVMADFKGLKMRAPTRQTSARIFLSRSTWPMPPRPACLSYNFV